MNQAIKLPASPAAIKAAQQLLQTGQDEADAHGAEVRRAYAAGYDDGRFPAIICGFVFGAGIVGAWWAIATALA